jgi:plasmid stabilization system protein ParE
VTRAEDIWTKPALDSLAAVPLAERDQLEALVAEICRDPYGRGTADPESEDLLSRLRIAATQRAVVYYQVVDDDIIRVTRVHWRA